MKGTIKKIMEKGFGFITPEAGGKDIFFHSNSLVGVQFTELREGDAVSFETEDTEKGKNAINVKRA
jgi:CspA family cold shock protein